MTLVNNQGGSLIPWYDRENNVIPLSFESILAPHVETVRITYTVPTSRRAIITGFWMAPLKVCWWKIYP